MTACGCGCGQEASMGKMFLAGHNRRKAPHLPPQDCACGCGQRTAFKRNGNPNRYVYGHHRFIRNGDVAYSTAHGKIKEVKTKTGTCEHCGKSPPPHRWPWGEVASTDFAFMGENGKYSTNPNDYIELCRSCHLVYDRRKETE